MVGYSPHESKDTGSISTKNRIHWFFNVDLRWKEEEEEGALLRLKQFTEQSF